MSELELNTRKEKLETRFSLNVEWPENRVFPSFSSPDTLYVIDLRNINFYKDFKHLPLTTLQGLVNREKPRIYIVFTKNDQEWLNELVKYTNIQVITSSSEDVMKKFSNYAKGYIVYDPSLPDTVNLATTMAGINDCIVIHPEDENWVKSFGIKLFKDLRGSFKSRYQVYLWAYENLWPNCSHRLLLPMSPGPPVCTHNHMQVAMRDYAIALKLFVHYLSVHNEEEREIFCKLLEEMPNNTAVLGWHGGEEVTTVALASIYNKFVVVMSHHHGPLSFANPTVWSGIQLDPPPKFRQPPVNLKKIARALDQKRIFVTFYVTDGDNMQFDFNLKEMWDDPHRGEIPIAWTVSPFLADIAPLIIRYYSETMSPNDTFVCGPSGAGYWYPFMNKAYISSYLNITKNYLERVNLRYVEILGFTEYAAAMYSKTLNIIAIKKEYSNLWQEAYYRHGGSAYYLSETPVPILIGVLHYTNKTSNIFKTRLLAMKETFKDRPLFLLIVSHPWDFKSARTRSKDLSKLSSIVKEFAKDDEFTFVNFHEFTLLLNPKYGIHYAEDLLDNVKNSVSPESLKEAEANLEKAKDFYNKKRWQEASSYVNKALQCIASVLYPEK